MKEISAQQLVVLAKALAMEGFNVQSHLKPWGLATSADSRARPWRSVLELEDFMRLCVTLSGDEGFGLVVATSQAQLCHGLLATLALHGPTLRTTLEDLSRFYTLLQDQREVRYTVADQVCTIDFEPLGLAADTRRFRAEQIMGGLLALSRFCGLEDDDLFSVTLRHERPAYAHRYVDVFGPNLSFSADSFSIQFNASILDVPRVHCDADSYTIARAGAVAALEAAAGRTSIVESVRRIIKESGSSWIGMKDAALQLRMSERTLRRHLGDAGTSYAELFETMRMQEAKKLIGVGTIPLKQIAERSGYESVSNFNRAFKNKTGMTPLQWRQEAAGQKVPEAG